MNLPPASSPSLMRTAGGRIYNLSLVRMAAMASIILCHIVQYYKNETLALWLNTGVDVFLVLSGYLYGMRSFDFGGNKDRMRFAVRFYCKEFLKLLIPYYLMLAVAMPVYCMLGKASLSQIGKALLLVNDGIPGLAHLWFFRFIIVCYLATPFWYFIPERSWKNAILLVVFIAMIPLAGTGSVWIACYLLGMLLARLRYYGCMFPGAKTLVNIAILAAGCVLTACCVMKNVDRSEYNLLLNTQKLFLGGGLFVVLTAWFGQDCFGPWMQKFLKLTDAVSYELFLVHPLFLTGAFKGVMKISESRLVAFILFASCAALSMFFLHAISAPVKNFCFRLLKS